MKANTPERIYCESDGLGNIVKVHNIKWPDDEAENIEYSRTDAFVEKACEWITDNLYDHYDGNDEFGVCSGFVKSEEFIENFKKAMTL